MGYSASFLVQPFASVASLCVVYRQLAFRLSRLARARLGCVFVPSPALPFCGTPYPGAGQDPAESYDASSMNHRIKN